MTLLAASLLSPLYGFVGHPGLQLLGGSVAVTTVASGLSY